MQIEYPRYISSSTANLLKCIKLNSARSSLVVTHPLLTEVDVPLTSVSVQPVVTVSSSDYVNWLCS